MGSAGRSRLSSLSLECLSQAGLGQAHLSSLSLELLLQASAKDTRTWAGPEPSEYFWTFCGNLVVRILNVGWARAIRTLLLSFLSFPDCSDFFRIFSDGHKGHPFLPPISELFAFMFIFFMMFFVFSRFFLDFSTRTTHLTIAPFMFLPFPDFPIFSNSYHPSQNCSLSCSCHFRIFPTFPGFVLDDQLTS